MSLWQEIESLCMAIKHVPEQVDLEEARQLLRRAQSMIDAFEPMLNPATLIVERGDEETYTVTVSASYSSTGRDCLIYWMADIDG